VSRCWGRSPARALSGWGRHPGQLFRSLEVAGGLAGHGACRAGRCAPPRMRCARMLRQRRCTGLAGGVAGAGVVGVGVAAGVGTAPRRWCVGSHRATRGPHQVGPVAGEVVGSLTSSGPAGLGSAPGQLFGSLEAAGGAIGGTGRARVQRGGRGGHGGAGPVAGHRLACDALRQRHCSGLAGGAAGVGVGGVKVARWRGHSSKPGPVYVVW
jgi:hypothetical protein